MLSFRRSDLLVTVILFGLSPAVLVSAPPARTHFKQGNWPFQPLKRSMIPTSTHYRDWVRNPVDAFVVAKLQEASLKPNPRAGKLILLRRVTFDLTGLPPTPEEQREFLEDRSPDAYERLVDRLLSSPAYGERWAQHWLDVVRFAETEGFKSDRLRPNAFRYRDYVIRSFNQDRPYDEFVRQQLAGDQLQPGNPEALIATGLNRLYPDEDNAANLFQRRQEILDDLTETTGLAFLGLTMGCARCHDHKFDDILQTDFYRLQAFFAPIIERDDVYAASSEAIARYRRQRAKWEQATKSIRVEMDSLVSAARRKSDEYNLTKFRPKIRQCYRKAPSERSPLEQQIARMVHKQLSWRFDAAKAAKKLPKDKRERHRALERRLHEFDHLKPKPLPRVMAVSDVGETAPPTHLLAGGDWRKPKRTVRPGFPEFLGATKLVTLTSPKTRLPNTTNRRAQLAKWVTRNDHPLTARVIVNRLWHHHFGRGIVATPNDFGNMGEPPSHPKLLDWLAAELVDHGWSLKHIQRLIVTSAVYCQSSRLQDNKSRQRALRIDRKNRLVWRARRRRLDGETIRDAMLLIANGGLNRKMYGKSARPPLPQGVSPRYAWKPNADRREHFRRSIYVLAKRNMRFPLFDVFDLPDRHSSCARRTTTTNAPQSLLMLNSQLTQDLADRWAERLIRRCGRNKSALVTAAYMAAFGRSPNQAELRAAKSFLGQQLRRIVSEKTSTSRARPDPWKTAVADFAHALFNSNEFLFLD